MCIQCNYDLLYTLGYTYNAFHFCINYLLEIGHKRERYKKLLITPKSIISLYNNLDVSGKGLNLLLVKCVRTVVFSKQKVFYPF